MLPLVEHSLSLRRGGLTLTENPDLSTVKSAYIYAQRRRTVSVQVGQGIRDKMKAAGDEPFKSSTFSMNDAGQQTETGYGLMGNYRAMEVRPGHWRVEGPLPVAE